MPSPPPGLRFGYNKVVRCRPPFYRWVVVVLSAALAAGLVLTGEPVEFADKGTTLEMKLSNGGTLDFEEYHLRAGYLLIVLAKAPAATPGAAPPAAGAPAAPPALQLVDFSRRFELTGKDLKISGNSGDYDTKDFTFTGPVDLAMNALTGKSNGLVYDTKAGTVELTAASLRDSASNVTLSGNSMHLNLNDNTLNATGSVAFKNATVDLTASTLTYDRARNRLTAEHYHLVLTDVGTLDGDSLEYDTATGTAVLHGKLDATLTPPAPAGGAPNPQ